MGLQGMYELTGASQNFSRISRVSPSHSFSGYVRLADSIFIRRFLGVSILRKLIRSLIRFDL